MTDFQEALMRLDLFITQKMRQHNVPAMSLGLTDDTHTLFSKTEGLADVGARQPLVKQSLFQIGSIGKLFTAILVLQEVENGTIDLHAPLNTYLEWFRVHSTFDEPITVHHLLTHTAGIIAGTDDTGEHRYEAYLLRHTHTGTPPGTYFHYSNIGYKILTALLENVTGIAYGELVQARILDPLGMTNTLPVITHHIRHRLAVGYTHLYDDRPPLPGYPFVPAPWFEYGYGDGSIVSNASDMLIFLRCIINRGLADDGQAVITDTSFDLITTAYTEAFGEHHYGYGVTISTFDDITHFGHGGNMLGYSSIMLVDAINKLGVIVLANHAYCDLFSIADVALRLTRAAHAKQPLPKLPLIDEPSLIENATDFTGMFTASNGNTLSFIAEGRHLYLQLEAEDIQLFRRDKDRFVVSHPVYSQHMFEFSRNDDGAITEVIYGDAWYVNDTHTGITTFETPEIWHAYVGRYRSHNFWNPTFRVIIRKGQLLMLHSSGYSETLQLLEEAIYRPGMDERSPERLHFDTIIDGRALRAILSGAAYYRFFTP